MNKEDEKELVVACSNGYVMIVKKHIDEGVDPNTYVENFLSHDAPLLWHAIFFNQDEVVEYLLRVGADPHLVEMTHIIDCLEESENNLEFFTDFKWLESENLIKATKIQKLLETYRKEEK